MSAANAGAKDADPSKSFHLDVVTWIDKHPEKLSTRVSLKSNGNRRTEFFSKIGKYWIVFPGGPGTLQELGTGLSAKYYNEKNKPDKIILVNRKFFKPIKALLENMDNKQLTKNVKNYAEMADTEEEILKIIHDDKAKIDIKV